MDDISGTRKDILINQKAFKWKKTMTLRFL